MVPKGWSETFLKNIISGTIRNGYSPLPAANTTGYWVMGLGAITDDGINSAAIKPVDFDEKVKQALLVEGDFLISRSNTPDKVGRSIRFKGEVENCSYPDLMMRFCVDSEKADPSFIELKLKSSEVRQYYKSCAAGSSSTMVKINKAVVENTPLILPSFPEQKKIAKILSTWDQAIASTDRLLDLARQQKKALMQQLLTGKKRLRDKNGARFCENWEKTEIGELLCESRISSKDNAPSKRLTVRLNLKGVEARELRGTEAVDSTAYFVRSSGQFIYGKQNIHKGAFGIIPDALDAFESSQDLPAFDFTGKCDSAWFLHFMSQESFYTSLEGKMSGTGSKRLNPKIFFKANILCSRQKAEQEKIAAVLSGADQEIETLQSQLEGLKQEKKALMQQLLTGKRRVVVRP